MKAVVTGKHDPPNTIAPRDALARDETTQRPVPHSRSFDSVLEQLTPGRSDEERAGQSGPEPERRRQEEDKADLVLVFGTVAQLPLVPSRELDAQPDAQAPVLAQRENPVPSAGSLSDTAGPLRPEPLPTMTIEQQGQTGPAHGDGPNATAWSTPAPEPSGTALVQTPPEPSEGSTLMSDDPKLPAGCGRSQESRAGAGETAGGITDAQLLPDMKLAQNWNEIAAGAPKLPSDAAAVASVGDDLESQSDPDCPRDLDFLPVAGLSTLQRHVSNAGPEAAEMLPPVIRPEQLLDIVLREVRLAHGAGEDTVSVLLKTDSQAAIQLRITLRDGQIEVKARCDQNDFAALNAHWLQLRQSLADHGVRLEPLTQWPETPELPGFDPGRNPANGHSHPRQQPAEGEPWHEEQSSVLRTRLKPVGRNHHQSRPRLEFWA